VYECKFDGWTEHFDPEKWSEALREADIDISFYTERRRAESEVFPWDIIDMGVSKEFLLREKKRANQALTTHDCRWGCVGCGINKLTECPFGGVFADE